MSPLDQVRARAASLGIEDASCSNCGMFEPSESTMGFCRRTRAQQFDLGICVSWGLSTIAPPRTSPVVEVDGTKRLFPGAEPPGQRPVSPTLKVVQGLRCAEPDCDGTLEPRWSPKVYQWFYGCSRYPDCNGVMPANLDGSPRGEPRTRELQGWRVKAHAALDCLWKDGHCDRGAAYSWLRAATGLDKDRAHVMQMSMDQCQTVINLVVTHGPGTEFWEQWKQARAERKKQKARTRRRRGPV